MQATAGQQETAGAVSCAHLDSWPRTCPLCLPATSFPHVSLSACGDGAMGWKFTTGEVHYAASVGEREMKRGGTWPPLFLFPPS